jgi:hypothetical protein
MTDRLCDRCDLFPLQARRDHERLTRLVGLCEELLDWVVPALELMPPSPPGTRLAHVTMMMRELLGPSPFALPNPRTTN